MKIGFDAHMVGQRETGNETYALGLLQGFEQIGTVLDTYSFTRLPSSIHRQHRIWPKESYLRVPVSFPAVALRDRLALLHCTYVLPPWLPCAGVVTVHDISYELHPEWFKPSVKEMLAYLVPLSIRRARAVITVSQAAKLDIIERYSVDPNKVTVTYEAPRPAFSSEIEPVPESDNFFLYVGNIEPRKNVNTLLRAIRILLDRGTDTTLVLAGKLGFRGDELRQLVRELHLENAVHMPGYVSDTELRSLYGRCIALVHPALYEGFGLTPLEAMAQGVPVVVANTSSIPEVVGDAALLVDPTDPEAWAHAMEDLLHNPETRREMRRLGLDRARLFTWKRCAVETRPAYERALQREGGIH